jgi:hypothetical protein
VSKEDYYDKKDTPDYSPWDDFLASTLKRLGIELCEDGRNEEAEDVLDLIIYVSYSFMDQDQVTRLETEIERLRDEKKDERILEKYKLISNILDKNNWLIHSRGGGLRGKVLWKRDQKERLQGKTQ